MAVVAATAPATATETATALALATSPATAAALALATATAAALALATALARENNDQNRTFRLMTKQMTDFWDRRDEEIEAELKRLFKSVDNKE